MMQPAPSSDMKERLGTTLASRVRSLENRLGTRCGPPQGSPQETTSTAAQHARMPQTQRKSQADTAAVMDTMKVNDSLWNRPDPSPWGRYKADMTIKLNMKTLTCPADAKKVLNGHDSTVSALYRIAGVDWLLAEDEQFSSVTTL